MSARVLYISRVDRGAQIVGARLVGPTLDAAWTAPAAAEGDAEPRADEAARLAEWAAATLAGKPDPKRIDRLVLDASGAVCSWVRAPSADARLIAAMVEQDTAGGRSDDTGDDFGGAGRFPDLPGELAIEPMGAPLEGMPEAGSADAGPRRFGVFVGPDVPARAVLDALDGGGLDVGAAVSIWHAMAAAWDPGVRAAAAAGSRGEQAHSDDGAVMQADGLTAVVVSDAALDRVLWCWSRGGTLIAAGAVGAAGGRATAGATARLSAEWLAWTAQLGIAPQRVVAVCPLDAGSDGGDGATLGSRLARALPEATVDVVDEGAGVGLTLRRYAEAMDAGAVATAARLGSGEALAGLSSRAGRSHRAMYRWTAAALAAGAVLVFAGAWRLSEAAAEIATRTERLAEARREALAAVKPDLARDAFWRKNLSDEVEGLRRANATAGAEEEGSRRAILEELETLSLVLASDQTRIETITVNDYAVAFIATVPDTQAVEGLQQALRSVAGSAVVWERLSATDSGGRKRVNGTGTWAVPSGRSASGTGGAGAGATASAGGGAR